LDVHNRMHIDQELLRNIFAPDLEDNLLAML
jgi:hypothetical protein